MRISKLKLENFKRFTDLSIDNIPVEAKLVLVIGSNGSGKSSIFDAFHALKQGGMPLDEYYQKGNAASYAISIGFHDQGQVTALNAVSGQGLGYMGLTQKFFGRTSIRIVPRISNNANPGVIKTDADRPVNFIEQDARLPNDVFSYMQRIDDALRAPVFEGRSADTLQIFQDLIRPFNESLVNIFGADKQTTIQISRYQNATPYSAGQLIFKKGNVEINYDLLSHGEKQVVILLLNFIVRYEYYKDALIFIDEMDCHLNTSLQQNLLHEIVTRWIPDSSQFWTASHALGFIDYARKSDEAAIIDLNGLDFDQPQLIVPSPTENLDVYEIAIPKETIANILTGKKLVVVENKNDALFNLALGEKSYLFLPAQNNREVFLIVKHDDTKLGLRDRDFLKDAEIEQIQKQFRNFKILRYYTFENYLYHPENLAEINLPGFDKDAYRKDILDQKHAKLVTIAASVGVARQGYTDLKEAEIKNKEKENIEEIVNSLQSDDFEAFYKYFSMKTHYSKQYLSAFNLEQKQLVQTKWFQNQIENILNS
jgi:hypothetical protein